jgi:hemolysin activation/secretion protein
MPGLIRGVARTAVVAGTATAVSGRVQRRQQGRWAAQEQQQQAQYQQQYEQQPQYEEPQYAQPAPPPAAAPVDTDSKIDQLKELGALRDSGVLTEAEFAVQKAKLLG